MPSLENIGSQLSFSGNKDEPPNLMSAFNRAVKSSDDGEGESGAGSGLDKAKSPQFLPREKSSNNQNKDRER